MPVGTRKYKTVSDGHIVQSSVLKTKMAPMCSFGLIWDIYFPELKFLQVINASVWIYLERHTKGYLWLWNIKCSRNSKNLIGWDELRGVLNK